MLDDAIREHLELKRQRGADAEEVSRQESEALGPVVRESAAERQRAQVSPAAPAAPPQEQAAPPATESPAEEHPPEPAQELIAAPEPAPVPEPDPIPEPELVVEPEPEPELNPHPTASQPTAQFSSEDVAEAMGRAPLKPPPARRPGRGDQPRPGRSREPQEPGEHDELEETPEFLQEAPEHDKLWFEQKPPKDFDF